MIIIVELMLCLAVNGGLLFLVRRRQYFDRYMAWGVLPCVNCLDKALNVGIWCVQGAALVFMLASGGGRNPEYWGLMPILTVWLFYIALIDVQERKIPNALLGSLIGVRVVLWGMKAVFTEIPERGQLIYQSLYTCILLLALLFVAMIAKGGFGYGDVKLLTVMSLFLDYGMLMSVILTALLAALACALYLMAVKKTDRKAAIPFAPFFYFGFVLNSIFMLSR